MGYHAISRPTLTPWQKTSPRGSTCERVWPAGLKLPVAGTWSAATRHTGKPEQLIPTTQRKMARDLVSGVDAEFAQERGDLCWPLPKGGERAVRSKLGADIVVVDAHFAECVEA